MKLLLGFYPPTSKVYVIDTVKTLLENSFMNFNSTIPIINSDGKLVGKLSKVKLARWLLDKLVREEPLEKILYLPISNINLEIDEAKHVEVFELNSETIFTLLSNKKDYEIYITHDGILIGEFPISSLLYISSWKSDVRIRIEELPIKELPMLEHEASIIDVLNYLLEIKEPELIGLTFNNNLVGIIMIEDILYYMYNIVETKEIDKLKNSKSWIIASPDFSLVYVDENLSKALRVLKRTRDKKFLVVQNRKEEVLGYINIKDVLLQAKDEILLKLFTQRIKER